MYTIEYLPAAKQDLLDIARYIAGDIASPAAAERITTDIVAAIDSLAAFPYRRPVYIPLRPLKHEMRSIASGNYLAFYWVSEESQTVTIARVLYARADVSNHLASSGN